MTLLSTHRRLITLARIGAAAGGLSIIGISIMITIDIFLRKFAGTTLGGANEIAGLVFAVAVALSYPFVLLDRAHVRIDVVYSRLRPMLRACLDIFGLGAVLGFVAMLTSSVFGLFLKSWVSGSRSVGVVQVPLWIPQSVWVLGFVLFTITAAFLLFAAIAALLRKDFPLVGRIVGVPSIEETIEEETHLDTPAKEESN
jgi:TRAP-type C4-dicarboxylate transport system permease small subunit